MLSPLNTATLSALDYSLTFHLYDLLHQIGLYKGGVSQSELFRELIGVANQQQQQHIIQNYIHQICMSSL